MSGLLSLKPGFPANLESGIWNLESGIWNLESGIWNEHVHFVNRVKYLRVVYANLTFSLTAFHLFLTFGYMADFPPEYIFLYKEEIA